MSVHNWFVRLSILTLFLVRAGAASAEDPADHAKEYERTIKPFLTKYCISCHGEKKAESDYRLDALSRELAKGGDLELWREAVDRAVIGEMPPMEASVQPTQQEIDVFAAWVHSGLLQGENARAGAGGRVVIRRLSRFEYLNTIQDIFGFYKMPIVPSELPEDGVAFGFDTVGSAKTLDPVSFERYLVVAEKVLANAILEWGPKPEPKIQRAGPADFVANRLRQVKGSYANQLEKYERNIALGNKNVVKPVLETLERENARTPNTKASGYIVEPAETGLQEATVRLPSQRERDTGYSFNAINLPLRTGGPGEYILRLRASSVQNNPANLPALLAKVSIKSLFADAKKQSRADVNQYELGPFTLSRESQAYETRLFLDAAVGESFNFGLACAATKGFSENPQGAERHDGVILESIEVEGPFNETWPPQPYQTVFFKGKPAAHDREYAREIISQFAAKAFRRPATEADVAHAVKIYDWAVAHGRSFERAIVASLQTVLVSPDFLFLIETTVGSRKLSSHEIASRLSYFLWSSPPDEELLDLAAAGKLAEPAVLASQVKRMMADPKSERFVENFTGQWLALREFGAMAPSKLTFPDFDPALARAMQAESQLFCSEIFRNDRSILEFIDSDWTYANSRLAYHYGIRGMAQAEMKRISLQPEDRRGGVLTQGSVLQMTSDAERTKPIRRAAYILSHILGTPPPPPPATAVIPQIANTPMSLRARLELHRRDANCASCHNKLDPLGFVLENYDGVGKWRDSEETPPDADGKTLTVSIDPSGTLPDGRSIQDLADLKKVLLTDRNKFARTTAENLMIYALGRGLEFSDRETIDRFVERLAQHDYKIHGLLTDIVTSEQFLTK